MHLRAGESGRGADAAWDMRGYPAIVAGGVGRHHQRLAGGVEGDGHVRVHRLAQGHHGLEVPHVECRIAGRTPAIAEVQEYVAAQVQLRVQLLVAVPCRSAKCVAFTGAWQMLDDVREVCCRDPAELLETCELCACFLQCTTGPTQDSRLKQDPVKLTRQGLRKVYRATFGRVLIAVQAHVAASLGF